MATLMNGINRARVIRKWSSTRSVSTLQGHPHIYTFPDSTRPGHHILSLLPSEPPKTDLAIGSTSKLPPTPDSFSENTKFLEILQDVVSKHATEDPEVKSQAQVMASTSGANLGSGGLFFAAGRNQKRLGGDSAGGASGQGGAGSGGRGGWIHVSDGRRPPEYGRIAWPEDIFGSVEVDGNGEFVGKNGNYQSSGTYRLVTRDGILGLSPFLRDKLVQRLREE
ncbi:hypothetical protein BGW36DRAFT_108571 [Talaromyces proteolyticus]|uniref:Uncharacterized protein n=1 Tax=Talaromyces proteolyticus TaxID=1131652 RepID=A0AAD4KWU6_9EURO|nr:uncharacterized protein BGW36DRAFT_108571 [Talaromyces proteolyticus]KAH8701934.1 hypothetical protein BGW36DRAFT_108571 [Talaromyces proteolyticus]